MVKMTAFETAIYKLLVGYHLFMKKLIGCK